MSIQELVNEDESFSESTFISMVDNTFIMLLSAIMMNDLDRIKHKLSNELYNKYLMVVNDLKIKNKRQMYDELNVKSTFINSIEKLDDRYRIEVSLTSRYMDYRVDIDTLSFIDGINDRRVEKENILVFEKSLDAINEKMIKKCPSCGASMDIANTGKCTFCGGFYDTEKHDWLLVDLKTF